MKFRTEIEPLRGRQPITHDNRIVMMGSCFTDNIGALLRRDGFNVSVNEMGVLYNPLSLAMVIDRALRQVPYSSVDLINRDGIWHCLDFESRRQSADAGELLSRLNADFLAFAEKLRAADTWIITFGTAWVFEHDGHIVGNCHKLDSREFTRRRLSVSEIVEAWRPLCQGRRVIFTVSPIRHLADGLHGNELSKSTLLLAVEQLGEYFPAYEIMLDDLRDYRFYADDLKHPSALAVDYIYEFFENTYFPADTKALALAKRKEAARQAHRPIIK